MSGGAGDSSAKADIAEVAEDVPLGEASAGDLGLSKDTKVCTTIMDLIEAMIATGERHLRANESKYWTIAYCHADKIIEWKFLDYDHVETPVPVEYRWISEPDEKDLGGYHSVFNTACSDGVHGAFPCLVLQLWSITLEGISLVCGGL